MPTYIDIDKVVVMLSHTFKREYVNYLRGELEEESIKVPGKVPGDELKQAALILQLIQEDIEEPLRATAERVLRAVSELNSPTQFSEEMQNLAEGFSSILLAMGKEELAEQTGPVLQGLALRLKILKLEKELETLIDDLNRTLQKLPGKCEEWQVEAHQLALEYLRDEYNIKGELTSSEKFWEIVREEVHNTFDRIIRQLAFNAKEIGKWDPSWTCLENLPPELRRTIESEIK